MPPTARDGAFLFPAHIFPAHILRRSPHARSHSPEQLAANRANATHSTGPATAAGKATSARNRTTHGFRSSTVLLPGDDPAEYNELLTELEAHFGESRDISESRFIREMADAEWRLRSVRMHMESAIARHMETLSAAHPELASADLQSLAIETLSQTGCSYGTWLRYESKFERQYERANNAWLRYQQSSRPAAAIDAKTTLDQVFVQTYAIPQPETNPEMGSNVHTRPHNQLTGPPLQSRHPLHPLCQPPPNPAVPFSLNPRHFAPRNGTDRRHLGPQIRNASTQPNFRALRLS